MPTSIITWPNVQTKTWFWHLTHRQKGHWFCLCPFWILFDSAPPSQRLLWSVGRSGNLFSCSFQHMPLFPEDHFSRKCENGTGINALPFKWLKTDYFVSRLTRFLVKLASFWFRRNCLHVTPLITSSLKSVERALLIYKHARYPQYKMFHTIYWSLALLQQWIKKYFWSVKLAFLFFKQAKQLIKQSTLCNNGLICIPGHQCMSQDNI